MDLTVRGSWIAEIPTLKSGSSNSNMQRFQSALTFEWFPSPISFLHRQTNLKTALKAFFFFFSRQHVNLNWLCQEYSSRSIVRPITIEVLSPLSKHYVWAFYQMDR